MIPNDPYETGPDQLHLVCNCGEFMLSMTYPGGATVVGRTVLSANCTDPGDHHHWFDKATDCGPHRSATSGFQNVIQALYGLIDAIPKAVELIEANEARPNDEEAA